MNEQMLGKGDLIVVAVSGGPDSTALLHILTELSVKWSFRLHVAHMDHGFRGEQSRQEAEWVRDLAERLGWPCSVHYEDIPAAIAASGGNPQEVAREARYRYLLEIARETKADAIALGHHADDQAETILMRLVRGTSLTGITGMAPVARREGMKLVRPLLRIYKEDIVQYLNEHGYGYCTDSSNEQRTYTRNRLRLDVLPILRSINPDLSQTINRMADLLRDEDEFLSTLAESTAEKIFRQRGNEYLAARDDVSELDVALQRRVIKLILSYLCKNQDQIQYIHIEKVREAIQQTDSPSLALHLPGVTFVREYDQLRFVQGKIDSVTPSYAYIVEGHDTTVPIREAGGTLSFRVHHPAVDLRTAGHPGPDSRHIALDMCDGFGEQCAYFDMEKITFPLTVRNRRPGDRIQLMNMQGTKKLKDLFIDLKVPPGTRDTIPLVFDAAGRLLWICGIRRSGHALVHRSTEKVLLIQFNQNESMSPNIDYLGG